MKSQSIDDGLDDDNSKNQSKKNTQWQSLINLELLHITNHHQYITSLAWSLFGNQIDVWCVWVLVVNSLKANIFWYSLSLFEYYVIDIGTLVLVNFFLLLVFSLLSFLMDQELSFVQILCRYFVFHFGFVCFLDIILRFCLSVYFAKTFLSILFDNFIA